MANVEAINLLAQRAEGIAAVLAIGTATPANVFCQADFADYYFRVTNSQHLVDLKHKFKRMCDKSRIRKRYMHLTEEMLAANPSIAAYMAPSLDARQDIVVAEVPKLGKEAADKAIKEWGRPKSSITHLVFCTATGIDMPGADLQLTRLLRLSPSVNRVMVYQQGCFGGGMALRLSKDLAENNRGARVLVVCSEITLIGFRGPCEDDLEDLVGHALFGDGAAAAIVGADPDAAAERPLFQLVSARQTIIPGTVDVVRGHLRESGLKVRLSKDLPTILAANMEGSVVEALGPLGISDWNSVFWAAHPGGPAIVDAVQSKMGLHEERIRATRRVLGEYGNMISACVLFVLDELRKWSAAEGKATTGEGLEWGLLLSFGPGLTVETLVLRACPLPPPLLPLNN